MTYCATCGSANVHAEEWRNVNTGEYVCSSDGDFYCGGCGSECSVTESRREAAEARLASYLRGGAACTCCALLVVPDAMGRALGERCRLEEHQPHCDAYAECAEP